MWAVALVVDKGVVDCGHEEVSDAATRVAETGNDSVSGADDVLVEEACRPDLAGNEATTKDLAWLVECCIRGDMSHTPTKKRQAMSWLLV